MKKLIGAAVVVAALSAPVFAGGLSDPLVDATQIVAPEVIEEARGSIGSVGSGGAVLPALAILALLGLASSSGT